MDGQENFQLAFDFDRPPTDDSWTIRVFGVNLAISSLSGSHAVRDALQKAEIPFSAPENAPQQTFVSAFYTRKCLQLNSGSISCEPRDLSLFFRLFSVTTVAEQLRLSSNPAGELCFSHSQLPKPISLHPELAAAVCASDLSILASPETWAWVKSLIRVPMQLASLKEVDRHLSKLTTKRHQLLDLDLVGISIRKGLWEAMLPNSIARKVSQTPGVVWDEPVIDYPLGESSEGASKFPLTDSRHIAANILVNGAAFVSYGPQLAVESTIATAISLLPEDLSVAIYTDYSGLFAWRRAFSKFRVHPFMEDSRVSLFVDQDAYSNATSTDRFDVSIVDATHQKVSTAAPFLAKAFNFLDQGEDSRRVAITPSLPTTAAEKANLLTTLMPSMAPLLSEATHLFTETFLNEIVTFRSHLTVSEAVEVQRTPNVVPLVVTPGSDISGAVKWAVAGGSEIDHIFELCTVGTDTVLSPKIVTACRAAVTEARAGGHVLVLTRFKRAAKLIEASLPSEGFDSGSVTVQSFSSAPRIPKTATVIVLVDYPLSFDSLFSATKRGDRYLKIINVHMAIPQEDYLAHLAASNSGKESRYPLTEDEVAWILK